MAVHDDSAPDFTAMYRELGVDATCSLADLRAAWRRRVSKLHPDQGGSAEDTGRLQELNRRYDAAVAFHARFGRLPGAPAPGALAPPMAATEVAAPDRGWRRADAGHDAQGAAGFGAVARYSVAVPLIAVILATMLLLAMVLFAVVLPDRRSIGRDSATAEARAGDAPLATGAAGTAASTAGATDAVAAGTVAAGQNKDTVRSILGEPIDMHALRWHYGPSWVDFRCDKVAGWYSSPLRPLRTATARVEAPPADDARCD